MSAAGNTGTAPHPVTPQPLDQTALEMEAGRKALERYAAQRRVPVAPATGATGFAAKGPTGNTGATRPANGLTGPTDNVIPFDCQNAKPAAALAGLPDLDLAEGITPFPDMQAARQPIVSMADDSRKREMPGEQPGSNADQTKQGTSPQSSEALNAAESYIRAGWHGFPGKRRKKTPKTGWSWTKDKLTLADAPKYFDRNQNNVLVALGKASNNLTDIDLDWSEAVAAANLIFKDLPSFGRSGKPRSHRLAICDDIKTHKYLLPQSLANHPKVGGEHAMCIAEIRNSGAYTVFPGSEHESGQKIEWTDAAADNIAALRVIDGKALLKSVGLLAFVAFCMRFFPAIGARCDFMMAVAGALERAGYDGDMIQQIVQHVGAFNHDEGDNGTWRVAADTVANKLNEDKEVTGLPTLIKVLGLGDDILKWCRDMLGTTQGNVSGPVVPKNDHMDRARIYREKERPNLYHYRDDFYDYEGGHYTMVDDQTIEANLYSFLDKCGTEVCRNGRSTIAPFEPDTKSIHETINALEAVGHVLPTIEQPCWLDGRTGPDPAQLICFPNGVLDLSTNQFMPPDPRLFTPHGVAFNYDPNAPEPVEWLNFLNQIFDGDQNQIDALRETFGYCVSGDVSQEKVFLIIGPPRSGKDTIRHTLQSTVSPKAVCGPTLDSMGTNFGMSALIGKQLAIVGDMRLGSKCDKDLLAENILKLSGRGLFTIDRKHKDHWTGQLTCKLLLISNEMPKIKDTSGALASRLVIFYTLVSFYGREDPHLFRDKIKPELPGILNWSLEGLRRVHQRGSIAEPACSIEAREELAREGSPVLAFVRECLTLDPAATIDKDVLYSTYLDYAADHGLHPTSKSWFYRDLATATAGKVKAERVQKNGDRVHNIVGATISNPLPKRPQLDGNGGGTVEYVQQTVEDVGEPHPLDADLDARLKALTAQIGGGDKTLTEGPRPGPSASAG